MAKSYRGKAFAAIEHYFWLSVALLFGRRLKSDAEAGSNSLYVTFAVLSVLGSIALTCISFLGSFAAASDYARHHGIDASVANYIPISVDGIIVLSIIVLFSASLGGYSSPWLSLIIIGFRGISIYFNIQHIDSNEGDNRSFKSNRSRNARILGRELSRRGPRCSQARPPIRRDRWRC